MPTSGYYNGDGDTVMKNMKKEYGAKKGKQVFYATANKKGLKPQGDKPGPKSPKRTDVVAPARMK